MGIRVEHNESTNRVEVHVSGVIRAGDLLDFRARIKALGHTESTVPRLIDLTEVTHFDLGSDELRLFQSVCSRREVAVAAVAPGDLSYGMVRMLEAWSDDSPVTIRPFRDHEQALNWLEEQRNNPLAPGGDPVLPAHRPE